MAKYQKKPVVVEAWQLTSDNVFKKKLPDFLKANGDHLAIGQDPETEELFAIIQTLEGQMHASDGDFIIQGVNGEIYPCKPDIFHKTYEFVSD